MDENDGPSLHHNTTQDSQPPKCGAKMFEEQHNEGSVATHHNKNRLQEVASFIDKHPKLRPELKRRKSLSDPKMEEYYKRMNSHMQAKYRKNIVDNFTVTTRKGKERRCSACRRLEALKKLKRLKVKPRCSQKPQGRQIANKNLRIQASGDIDIQKNTSQPKRKTSSHVGNTWSQSDVKTIYAGSGYASSVTSYNSMGTTRQEPMD